MSREYYSEVSSRQAEQTRARAAKKRREKEAVRLRRLGVDEAWIQRFVFNDPDTGVRRS